MGDAIWLSFALPQWYFSTLAAPFSAGWLSVLPSSGAIALGIGTVLGAIRREHRVLWVLAPLFLSQLFVAVAGLFRGRVENSEYATLTFLLVHLGLSFALPVLTRKSRVAGLLLGWFNISYAVFAAFIASMSLSDTWL